VDRALDYFRKLQREDGGYPTYELEGESEVTMTANILLAQSLCVGRRPHLRQSMRRACQFLMERQRNDGRFEKSWSLCESYSMFRVIWALDVYPATDEAPRIELVRARALRYLRETQHADGGWGQDAGQPSDALSTAYALASLGLLWGHLPIEPSRIDRAVHYLLSQQDPETGGFVSTPDVAGPRPIPFDLPLLNTVFCLMGLSFAKPAGWAGGL
jgi:prenyltransferase beta subunit